MAPTQQKYYKELKNLTIDELYCYGIEIGLNKPTGQQRKDEIVKKIAAKHITFLDDVSKHYYFIRDTTSLEYVENPTDVSEFIVKTLINDHQVKIEKVKAEIAKERSISEHQASIIKLEEFQIDGDKITDRRIVNEPNEAQNNAQLSTILQTLVNNQSQNRDNSERRDRPVHFRQKLKYEPSHGIEAFIRSVEAYAAANEIREESKWIAIAKSALNSSEDGLLLQDSLSPAEEADWTLFKNKLLSILGNPPDYYRDTYRSFRRGNQKLGLAMSKITQAYKRGFLSNGEILSQSDKQHIIHQFIGSLDNPLRGLLKAEEKNLTFSNIADRAGELERCFGSGFMPDSAASLMFPEARVQMVEAANDKKSQGAVQLKMVELLSALTVQNDEMLKMMKNNKSQSANERGPRPDSSHGNNRNFGNRPSRRQYNLKELVPKLEGFCFFHVRYGSCKRDNCTFKHDANVPTRIKDAIGN